MAANDLYNAEFMDHVSHPDYKYQMDNPTVSHEGVNPSCGDDLTFSDRLEGLEAPKGIKSEMFRNKDHYGLTLVTLTYDISPRCPACNKADSR